MTSTLSHFAALTGIDRQRNSHDPAVARQTAVQTAAELFFAPLLKEMRAFPFGRDLTGGGQMHSAFAEQLDRRMAESVAARDQSGIVADLVRQLQGATRSDLVHAIASQMSAAGNTDDPTQAVVKSTEARIAAPVSSSKR